MWRGLDGPAQPLGAALRSKRQAVLRPCGLTSLPSAARLHYNGQIAEVSVLPKATACLQAWAGAESQAVMAGPYPSLPIQELVSACGRGEALAWEEFLVRTQPVVARACLRAARSWGERDPDLIEELVQATYTKLVAGRLLADFQPHHPDAIYGFLKLVAARVAHDHCKATRAAKRGGEGPEVEFDEAVAAVASPAAAPDAGLLLQEIEACLAPYLSQQEVNRDRLIFQLYYRLGLSAAAIASIPCLELSVKGVESLLNRLTRLARSRLTSGERETAAHGDD